MICTVTIFTVIEQFVTDYFLFYIIIESDNMKTKTFTMALLVAITLTMTVSVALASKPSVDPNFEWWQFYDGWGPAEYYGQKVLVHYTAVNKWTLEKTSIDGGFMIIQALTQNGVAEVYDATTGEPFTDSWGAPGLKGDLIESGLKFRVVENTKGISSLDQTWYHVYDIDIELQEWNYHWIITNGVYHYFGQYQNGEWSSKVLVP